MAGESAYLLSGYVATFLMAQGAGSRVLGIHATLLIMLNIAEC